MNQKFADQLIQLVEVICDGEEYGPILTKIMNTMFFVLLFSLAYVCLVLGLWIPMGMLFGLSWTAAVAAGIGEK